MAESYTVAGRAESHGEMKMNAQQILTKLEFAEVNGSLEPDTRRMMQSERFAVKAAVESGDGRKIQAAIAEALSVADMWNVSL